MDEKHFDFLKKKSIDSFLLNITDGQAHPIR